MVLLKIKLKFRQINFQKGFTKLFNLGIIINILFKRLDREGTKKNTFREPAAVEVRQSLFLRQITLERQRRN